MKIRESCGVFGINLSCPCFKLLETGIFNLQHRGQAWAGFAFLNEGEIVVEKKPGLVRHLFRTVKPVSQEIKKGIAHVSLLDPQPIEIKKSKIGPFALVLNGRILKREEVLARLKDTSFSVGSDAEILAKLVAQETDCLDGIRNIFQYVKGAFSIVIFTPEEIFAARDPLGFKPLILGKSLEGCAVASESVALTKIKMEIIRDVKPGEIVLIEEDGFRTLDQIKSDKRALCPFEISYFARISSRIDAIPVVISRHNMGAMLAKGEEISADLVSPIPFSGIGHAEGYHLASSIPYSNVFEYNRYSDRSWTPYTSQTSDEIAEEKLSINEAVIKEKSIILVDDSIFGATQIRDWIFQLKQNGALEIHVRISAPPVICPCLLDFPNRANKKLIASDHTQDEIRKKIGAQTLKYNTIEDFAEAIISAQSKDTKTPLKPEDLCLGCFTKKFPI